MTSTWKLSCWVKKRIRAADPHLTTDLVEVSPGFPLIAIPSSRKTFQKYQQNSGVKRTYYCLPCIIFSPSWQKRLSYLSSGYNLISHSIPPFSGRSLFPDAQSCSASCMPAQLLSQTSPLAEVFCLIQYLRLYYDFSSFQETVCSHDSSLYILRSCC